MMTYSLRYACHLSNSLLMQTLAYLLPVLTLALQKAEAEFEELAKVGKAHSAGTPLSLLTPPSSELG